MIKEVLQQLEPLDAQIDALSGADDGEMLDLTAHAAELAELAAQEDALLQHCTALTPEDRVFLARRPDRPHIDEIIDWGTARVARWRKTCAATSVCRGRRATARPCAS